MGGKAHHVPVQVHRPDGSTRGAFQGTRHGLPQAHRFHIDGSGKGTFCALSDILATSPYNLANSRIMMAIE